MRDNDRSVCLVATTELVKSGEQLDDQVYRPVGDVGIHHVQEGSGFGDDVE